MIRRIALLLVFIGAVCSLVLMFYAGRYNRSFLLMAMFTGWVLAPFAGFLAAELKPGLWPESGKKALYPLMILTTTCSIIAYSGLVSLPGTRPAFMFLVVPLCSWLVMVLAMLIVRRR